MDYTNEMLQKSDAFEGLTRTDGWRYVKGYVTEKIKSFTNRAIMDGFKSMEEYQLFRGEVAGLQGLLAEIEMSLSHLNKYRADQKSEADKSVTK